MNTLGTLFRLTTFGESHGPAIGGIIDGCPAGIAIDLDAVSQMMARRRPGQSSLTTARNEQDQVTFLSGINSEGFTMGTPIAFSIENTNQHSADYNEMSRAFRPGHADYTYHVKYGGMHDPHGGGRSSARVTAACTVGGSIALQALRQLAPDIEIKAWTSSIGHVAMGTDFTPVDPELNPVRCIDPHAAKRMEELILAVKSAGDTVGGTVQCSIKGCPVGLGEPVFDKLNARLAYAMMGINAAKGVEIGMGFDGASLRGSEVVDTWVPDDSRQRGISTTSNNSGGIQGGLSNGEEIIIKVAFKPVATLLMPMQTVDVNGNATVLKARGRHDPCVVPRAVPIVESMAAMTILDFLLMNRARKI